MAAFRKVARIMDTRTNGRWRAARDDFNSVEEAEQWLVEHPLSPEYMSDVYLEIKVHYTNARPSV